MPEALSEVDLQRIVPGLAHRRRGRRDGVAVLREGQDGLAYRLVGREVAIRQDNTALSQRTQLRRAQLPDLTSEQR